MKNLVVTTFLNNLKGNKLLNRCCSSVERQLVDDIFHIVIIDNCQGVMGDIESFKRDGYSRLVIYRLGHNGALNNIIYALGFYTLKLDAIVSIVDGDDQLKPYALKNINAIYKSNLNIIISSGGYVCESRKPARFDRDWDGYDLRKNIWGASHLRSFKYKLFQMVPEEYFKRQGEYFKTCADLALMWPMMELAGVDRYKHIDIPTYIYNDLNPENDHKVNRQQQIDDEKYIRDMYPLQRLDQI
jgi:hypothetical protein